MENKNEQKLINKAQISKITIKRIRNVSIFILIFLCLLYCVTNILWLDSNSIAFFYKEPRNSIDVIYIGASNAHHHFNTCLAYEKYGFTTGLLAADSQGFIFTKYCMIEAKKYQNPSLYVVDLARVADVPGVSYGSIDIYTDPYIRKTIDSLKFSKNRINAINAVLDYKGDVEKRDYLNYYISFFMYHDRWSELPKILKTKFTPSQYHKGYKFQEETTEIEEQTKYEWLEEIQELNQENKQILYDLIDYIKTNNLNVLFVVPPKYYIEELNKKINDAIKILEENGLKVINFKTLNNGDVVDYSTDFYNRTHLNVYGATKYTLYFSKYLKDNYDLKDRRDDKKYSSWDKEYERFKNEFKELTEEDFDELLMKYE